MQSYMEHPIGLLSGLVGFSVYMKVITISCSMQGYRWSFENQFNQILNLKCLSVHESIFNLMLMKECSRQSNALGSNHSFTGELATSKQTLQS